MNLEQRMLVTDALCKDAMECIKYRQMNNDPSLSKLSQPKQLLFKGIQTLKLNYIIKPCILALQTPNNAITEAAQKIGETLERAQMPYAIGGGIANNVWGIPHATLDLDVNVFIDNSNYLVYPVEGNLSILIDSHLRIITL